MRQNVIPFFTSEDHTTYTELAEFCDEEYAKKANTAIPILLALVVKLGRRDLSVSAAYDVLLKINFVALELASINPAEWHEFSDLVFQFVVIQPKTTTHSAPQIIREAFDSTLKGLKFVGELQ